MKKLLFFTLLISFNLFAASSPVDILNSLQVESFQFTEFVEGRVNGKKKETHNVCHFESESYMLQIDYCTINPKLDSVKKGILVNKFSGERLAIYIDDADNGKKISNRLSPRVYQNTEDGMNYAYQYGRASLNRYGDVFSQEQWKQDVNSLQGSVELQNFIDLLFNTIDTKLP